MTARGLPLVSYRVLTTGDAALPAAACVVLLDVMGPLAHCYALGRAAFVGGSLVPVGGHNVLEPARAGRPVVVGPYTQTAEDAVTRILAAGGGRRVRSEDDLEAALAALLEIRRGPRRWVAMRARRLRPGRGGWPGIWR